MSQSAFEDKISEYIARSGISKTVLSNLLNINVKTYDRGLKFLLNDSDRYKMLCSFLSLASYERDALDKLYINTLFSKDDLALINSVRQLMRKLDAIEIDAESPRRDGYMPVAEAMKLMRDSQKDRTVSVILYYGSSAEFESLFRFIEIDDKIKVRLIVPLKNDDTIENSIAITKCLGDLVPLMKYPENFVLRYIYDDDAFGCFLLKNAIIADSFALVFDDRGENSILFREKSVVDLMNEQFEHIFDSSFKLTSCMDAISYLEMTVDTKLEHSKDFYAFQSCCFIYNFLPPELVEKYIKKDAENSSKNIEKIINCFSIVNEDKLKTHVLFSTEGLKAFMKTGISSDFPPGICDPIEESDRIVILKNLIKYVESDPNTENMMIKQSALSFVRIERSAIYSTNNSVDIMYVHEKYGNVYITIKERHFVAAVSMLFKHLAKGRLTYSRNEMLSYLIDLLDEFKRDE